MNLEISLKLIEDLSKRKSDVVVYLLEIGAAYDGPLDCFVFEKFETALDVMLKDERTKDMKSEDNSEGYWYGESENWWGKIRPMTVIK